MSRQVLPTKLFVPRPDPDSLVRPRLLDLLSTGRPVPLVLVAAPAGAGKTTLVASWVEHRDSPVGWLSLDSGDDDPPTFLAGLVEACSPLGPGVTERAAALLEATPPPEPDVVAAALIADCAGSGATGTVVLDDYHMVEDPAVHGLVALLIERMPPGVTFVLVTRSDPPLPLARLRARGQLIEIRGEDLRFDVAEARTFLERFSARELRADSIASLASRTEGWAAGLQLAALALRTAPDPDAFVAAFAGTHSFVADYLTDEVLEALPAEHQEFLVRSSALNRMSDQLCDAALAVSGSGRILDALREANLFLVSLDDERRWFRYHHLFRDLLRRRLQSRGEGERRQILSRASAWCASNDLPDDAIRYAVDAGDSRLAADLVAAHGIQALADGRALTAVRWIELLPDDVVRSSPDHCVIAAWSHSLVEEHRQVVEYAESADARLAAGERPYRHVDEVEEHARVLLAGALTLNDESRSGAGGQLAGASTPNGDGGGRLADAYDQLTAALRRVSPDNLLLAASTEVMTGNTLNLDGRYEEALPCFARCHDLAERAGSELLRLAAATGTGESLVLAGRLREAVTLLDDVLGRRRALMEIIGSQVANLYAIRALAHLEAGRCQAAAADVRNVWSALGASHEDPHPWRVVARFGRGRPSAFHSAAPGVFYGLTVHVRLLIGQSDLEKAADQLDRFEVRLSSPESSIARVAIEALKVRLWLARTDRAQVRRFLRSAEPVGTGCAFWDRTSVLVLARTALSAHDAGTCLHLLEPILEELEDEQARLALAEARVLYALACAATGRASDANACADAAAELTAGSGLRMVWLQEGDDLRPLLQGIVARAAASPAAVSHALDLLAAFDADTGPRPAADLPELSERELEILRMVAAGHTNHEIADALFLAVGTVKKHTHNIYQKIGVSSRTRAVRVAREHGLLVPRE